MAQPSHQPTQAEIAACAYLLWEQEGRPQGRELDHWLEAEQRLCAQRRTAATSATTPPEPKRRGRRTTKTVSVQ
jgi:hypothetical protein